MRREAVTEEEVARVEAADAGPASRRTTLLVVAAYVLLTLWWLWPLPLRVSDHAICPADTTKLVAADLSLITWALTWDTHALLTRPLHLFDANVFHPAPLSLAFSEHFLGYVPLFAPTWLLTGNPVLAANVVILLTFPLCALATYALARRFVAAPAAFVAGAMFAFHGARYVNLYHLHQLGTFWIPLALLCTERWLERGRTRDALALSVVVAMQLLSSFYLAYAIVLFYGAYLPFALARWRDRLDRRRGVGLGLALVAGGAPAALASLPYLQLQRLGLVPSGNSAGIDLMLAPFATFDRIHAYLTSLGPGPVGYGLAAVALLVSWRRGSAYALVLGVVAVATGLVLAAGPSVPLFGREWWSPYALLFRYLPGFSAVRLPFRFLVVTQLTGQANGVHSIWQGRQTADPGRERILGQPACRQHRSWYFYSVTLVQSELFGHLRPEDQLTIFDCAANDRHLLSSIRRPAPNPAPAPCYLFP
ncbi:YfhO family protein [Candidatus Binatia bacterium]|nr:YfhO family protein [Candidatus Binatia bacterium]